MSWIQKQNEDREDYKDIDTYTRKANWCTGLWNDITKGWTFVVIFAVTVPLLVFFLVVDLGRSSELSEYTCAVDQRFRIPCGKENITSGECDRIACCYESITKQCYHYLPSKYYYSAQKGNYEAVRDSSPFDTDSVKSLEITVEEKSADVVSIVLKEANLAKRNNYKKVVVENTNYKVKLSDEKLMVEVSRSDTNDLLLSTSRGPLIASEKYWEWNVYLADHVLFGLNQTYIDLSKEDNFTKVFYKNREDHYSSPIIWAYRNGSFHGIKINHEGALELKILQSHLIVLRSITGGNIEIELAVGPTSQMLHDQQSKLPELPPAWVLENFICRRTDNLDLIQITEDFINQIEDELLEDNAQSFCIDDNLWLAIMKDNFTSVEEFQTLTSQISLDDKKFILSLPPQILVNSTLHQLAEQLDVLYKYNGTTYKGKYLNEFVVYPDFSHPNIQSFLKQLNNVTNIYFNVNVEGLSLTDNWPVDEKFKMDADSFPYFTEEFKEAMTYTIPWNATTPTSTLHVEAHNAYGPLQLEAYKTFYSSLAPEKVPFIFSASKSLDQTEIIFIENVNPSWENLKLHMQHLLFNSITGNHLIALPACGDTENYNETLHEKLCMRWYIVAATMPILKMSSVEPWREPSSLSSKFAQESIKYALDFRQKFLPIYYTILSTNQPIVRPMFYDFYKDNKTFAIENQYMVGERILIAHPLTLGVNLMQVYLPSAYNIWYEFLAGEAYNTTSDPNINITVRENDFFLFIAQGTIVPLKEDDNIDLVVALNCTSESCQASTSLLLLDEYVDFSADESSVTITNIPYKSCSYILRDIKVYRYQNKTRISEYFPKNQAICSGGDKVTVLYEYLPTPTTTQPTTTSSTTVTSTTVN